MTAENEKIKHLEMIQDIIARLAANSANLKTWTVTLTAGILVLTAKGSNPEALVFSFLPLGSFWVLDAYYLMHERRYRRLYDLVRKDTGGEAFSMNTAGFADVEQLHSTMFSPSILTFYGTLAVFNGLAAFLIFHNA